MLSVLNRGVPFRSLSCARTRPSLGPHPSNFHFFSIFRYPNAPSQAFETRAVRVEDRLDLVVEPVLLPCRASRTAEGLREAIVRSALAGPSG